MQDFFKIFEIFGANAFFIISFLGITAVYRFMIKTIEDERRRSDENLDKILELQNNSNKNIVFEMKEMVIENIRLIKKQGGKSGDFIRKEL